MSKVKKDVNKEPGTQPDDPISSAAVRQLPTWQRNALRKLFDRPCFSPEEVAALGYRRLQQAEGIGPKGLRTIAAWLAGYGFVLKPPELAAAGKTRKCSQRSIESAMRLLRSHGYAVRASDD